MAGIAGFGGATLGLFLNLRAHINFITSLEDPQGFKEALANVNARLDGSPAISRSRETGLQGTEIIKHDSQVAGQFHVLSTYTFG